MHVRSGDQVAVISGNHRGERGRVLRVIPKRNRVVIEGINMRTRHQRPSQKNPEGGIVTFEAPLHESAIMLVCPHCDAPARTRKRHDTDGTLERLCIRCGNPVPSAEVS